MSAGSCDERAAGSGRTAIRLSEGWFAFLLVLPALLGIFVVVLFPLAYSLWLSFTDVNLLRATGPAIELFGVRVPLFRFVGLQNYVRIFDDPLYWSSLWRTLYFVGAFVLEATLMGLGMALVLNERFGGRPLMRSLLLIPWSLSRVVVGLLWVGILDFEFGALNGLLHNLGLIDRYIPFFRDGFTALNVLVSVYMWNQAPFAALLFLAGMQSVSMDLYSAAEVDGAGYWQRFRYVTLPAIRPIMFLVLVLATVNGFLMLDLIYVLTMGGPAHDTTTISWLGFQTAFAFFKFGPGTAILYTLTALCLLVTVRLSAADPRPVRAGGLSGWRRSRRRCATVAIGVAVTAAVRGAAGSCCSRLVLGVSVWLIGPFVWLFVTSISYQRNLLARPLSFIPPETTLDNYRMILGLVRFHAEGQAAKILPAMLNSLIVASLVTALNLVVGTTAGYAYARYRFPLKTFSLFALLFTRMLPTVVLIPAFFLMLRALGLQNTLTGLTVAYCSFTLPFTVWIMKAYFETVPAELDKSALVDGCNRLQAYYRVVLPVSGPGLVAAGAFTFMLCWNEFIVAQVLNTKPGTTTLPPVIAGMNGQINIDYSVIAASGFLGALPAVLLVLIFQKYMVQGLTAGSVKG